MGQQQRVSQMDSFSCYAGIVRTALVDWAKCSRAGLINRVGIRCGNADSGGDVPTCRPTDPLGGCTGTAMPAGTFAPMPLRYARLPAAQRPITVGFRAPDAEAYLRADGHRLLAH